MSPLDGIALAQSLGWSGWWIVAGVVGVILFAFLFVIAQFFRLWLQAYMSNADVRMTDLIGMRLRKVNMSTIVFAKIQLVKSGITDRKFDSAGGGGAGPGVGGFQGRCYVKKIGMVSPDSALSPSRSAEARKKVEAVPTYPSTILPTRGMPRYYRTTRGMSINR